MLQVNRRLRAVRREAALGMDRRRGMTLVELMVVVTVILLLVAVSIPAVRPAIQDGYLREASRQLNVFVAAAKARAAQLDREVGIRLERTMAGANSCAEVFLVETPAPYSGDFLDARATLIDGSPINGIVDQAVFSDSKSTLLTTLIKVGDLIRFDHRGSFYRITAVTTNASGHPQIAFQSQTGSDSPYPSAQNVTVPYQIQRQPVRTGARALQLASGACIDLEYSGHGAANVQFNADNDTTVTPPVLDDVPVDIIFSPRGGVSRIYYGVLNAGSVVRTEFIPAGPVYLLVGRIDQTLPSPLMGGGSIDRANLQDPVVTWLAIGDREGYTTVGENFAQGTTVLECREIARSGQTMGGG